MKHTFLKWPLLLTVAFCGTLAQQLQSQDNPSQSVTNTLSLDSAIRIACDQNPELRASGARVDAAIGRGIQSGKWPNPELELAAEEWPVSGGGGFSDAKQTLGIGQTLPFPGKKSLDKQTGRAGVRLSEAELALSRTALVRDVKVAFFRVLAYEQLVHVATQLVAMAESAALTSQKRVDAGAAAFQEQLRAEIQWEQTRTDLTERQRDLDSARRFLGVLLGRPDLWNAKLAGAMSETPDARLTEDRLENRLTGHPSAVGARVNLDRAQLEYRRTRLDPYPDVNVSLAGGRLGETDQSIIQLEFTVPLPILDRGKGKQQEARARVRAAEAEQIAVQHQLHLEWANAQKRHQAAMNQVTNYRERILPKADEALRLVRSGFEQGKFNFIDLLDTQRTHAEARLSYLQKLLELNIAQAELEAILEPQTLSSSIPN